MAKRLADSEYKKRSDMFANGFHWCVPCQEFIALRNFSKSKNTPFGYLGICKQCHNKKRKGNLNVQSKGRNYNRQLKSYYKDLMGRKCTKCGYGKAQSSLEFHHVIPEEKEYTVTKLIGSNDDIRIRMELEKCILLCRNCHIELGSFVWEAEFVKVDGEVGYQIKEGSIIENESEYWAEIPDKILYSQNGLF